MARPGSWNQLDSWHWHDEPPSPFDEGMFPLQHFGQKMIGQDEEVVRLHFPRVLLADNRDMAVQRAGAVLARITIGQVGHELLRNLAILKDDIALRRSAVA